MKRRKKVINKLTEKIYTKGKKGKIAAGPFVENGSKGEQTLFFFSISIFIAFPGCLCTFCKGQWLVGSPLLLVCNIFSFLYTTEKKYKLEHISLKVI
jgi:hypothetical protein